MPMGILFYVLMLIWLVFGVYRDWPSGNYGGIGGSLILFLLMLLLGWRVFGPPLQ